MKRKNPVPLQATQGAVPAKVTSFDAAALQALSKGAANEGQQKHALKWILEGACGLPQWPYRESQRETDIALGRHFVGQQIVGLLNMNISKLKEIEERTNV